jgi:hypothetical protein
VSGLTCSEFVEMVTAFLDSALDGDTERRFVTHISTCPGCDRYLNQFLQTIHVLGDLPAMHLPAAST